MKHANKFIQIRYWQNPSYPIFWYGYIKTIYGINDEAEIVRITKSPDNVYVVTTSHSTFFSLNQALDREGYKMVFDNLEDAKKAGQELFEKFVKQFITL